MRLLEAARAAGALGIADLAASTYFNPQNAKRDLMRALSKNVSAPPLFWHEVPIWDRDEAVLKSFKYPFLLPHECLPHYVEGNPALINQELSPQTRTIFNETVTSLGMGDNIDHILALGLHIDAVPIGRKQSMECITFNVLGHNSRFLVTVIEDSYLCKCGSCSGRHTLDPLLSVMCWSLRCLLTAQYPSTSPSGAPWQKQDSWRLQKVHTVMPIKALMLQMRGDWACYKQVFSFPGWQSKHICWKCIAGREDSQAPFTDFSMTAAWRSGRLTEVAFWARSRAAQAQPSPLFSLPGFGVRNVTIDVLHAVDLGVAQDVVGNLFWHWLRHHATAPTNKGKILQLWQKLREHYTTAKTTTKLQALTWEMVKLPEKAPKLRAKAAETRGVVPFALQVCQEMYASAPDTKHLTMLQCCSRLMDFYAIMSVEPFEPDNMATTTRELCLLYSALRKKALDGGEPLLWKPKPKMHLLQELGEFQAQEWGNPKFFWTYRDEDHVGQMAQVAVKRGGAQGAVAVAGNVLQRFRVLEA